MPPLSVLAILAIFVILTFFVSRVEGLTFLAPKSTKRIKGAAQHFCLDDCQKDGKCPLETGAANCPLWRFVDADVRTDFRIDAFRQMGGIKT